MRRVILKYDRNLNLREIAKYCIKETQNLENKGEIIFILTEDGFKYCSENFPSNIIKSNKVDLYDVNVFAETSRACREIINYIPYNETAFKGSKSEYLYYENLFGFTFKIYLSESEHLSIVKLSKGILLSKVKSVVKCKCISLLSPPIISKVLIELLKGSGFYSLSSFELLSNDRGNLFDLYIDSSKVDLINKHNGLKVNSVSLYVDYK